MHRPKVNGANGRAAVMLLAAAALGGCGSAGPGAAGSSASAAELLPPTVLAVTVMGDAATVTWTAAHASAPVAGYRVYLDQLAPNQVGSTVNTASFGSLVAGSSHLVQVVSVDGADQSVPVSASFTLPKAKPTAPAKPAKRALALGSFSLGAKAAPPSSAPAPAAATGAPSAGQAPAAVTAAAVPTGQAAAAGAAVTFNGTLTVTVATGNGQYGANPGPKNTGECQLNPNTADGYDDIHDGAQVTVRDASGATVGLGVLGNSKFVDTYKEKRTDLPPAYVQTWGYCQWSFSVSNIPAATFYSIEVAHRGQVSFSAADLAKGGWRPALSVGTEPK